MSDAITRCPKCGTSFRITEAHLNSAKGAVRCGSCLNIFNAKQNLIEEQAPATDGKSSTPKVEPAKNTKQPAPANQTVPKKSAAAKPLTNKPKAKPAPPVQASLPEDDIDIDDDALISDDMDGKSSNFDDEDTYGVSALNENVRFNKPMITQESNLFEREIVKEEEEPEASSDESWALNLLKNLDEEDEKEQPKLFKSTQPEAPAKPKEEEPKKSKRIPPKKPEEPKDEDQPLEDLFSRRRTPEEEKELSSPFQIIEDPEELEEESVHSRMRRTISFDDLDEEIDEGAYRAPGRFYDSNKQSAYIASIEPEPVEFAFKKRGPFWQHSWVWRIGVVVASLLLIAEIAWLQFPNLSRIEPYRAYYGAACSIVGCRLPALIDRSKIRAANLVVRSHPTIAEALIVDAVLQNSAAFAQTYPDLDLIFTDVKDTPVAARRFTPQEYLGGELAGSKNMPAGQPVHIAIEIRDPGANAVSYRIAIAN